MTVFHNPGHIVCTTQANIVSKAVWNTATNKDENIVPCDVESAWVNFVAVTFILVI